MVFQHGGHQQTIKQENYLNFKRKQYGLCQIKDIDSIQILCFLNLECLNYLIYTNITKLPSSFNGMFAPFVEPNRTQSFKLELIRIKYLKPFPKIFLTRIWNSVPMNIKCSLSVLSFKTNMKIYLASKYKEFKSKNRNCNSCNLKIL